MPSWLTQGRTIADLYFWGSNFKVTKEEKVSQYIIDINLPCCPQKTKKNGIIKYGKMIITICSITQAYGGMDYMCPSTKRTLPLYVISHISIGFNHVLLLPYIFLPQIAVL